MAPPHSSNILLPKLLPLQRRLRSNSCATQCKQSTCALPLLCTHLSPALSRTKRFFDRILFFSTLILPFRHYRLLLSHSLQLYKLVFPMASSSAVDPSGQRVIHRRLSRDYSDSSDDSEKEGVVAAPKSTPQKSSAASTSSGRSKNGLVLKPSLSLESYDVSFKVMLVGDSGVGKTCLLVRYKDGAFLSGVFISTVGIDYRNKVVNVDDTKVKLQIWDTAGQERFRSVTHAYYRDAHALLLLYDVTNKSSFDNTRAWLGEINEYAQDDVVIMLIGNKADATSERHVMYEDGERLAKEYGVAYMETSAKTGNNVELAFMAVARELKFRQSYQPNQEAKFNVKEYVRQESTKTSASSGCCG